MKKRKKNNENQIKIFIFIVAIFLLVLLIYGISLLSNRNNNVLLDSSKPIVYTTYKNSELNKDIPQVNIKKISDDINNQIIEFTNPYKDVETNAIKYNYEVNGNVLSLIVIIENYEIEGPADTIFLSYNIDLKKLKVLSNEELLKLFNYDENTMLETINKNFNDYYQDELDKRIIKNMTYEEYLNIHEIYDLRNQMYYYVKEGKLNIYVDFLEWASEETEDYFVDKSYIFEIQ